LQVLSLSFVAVLQIGAATSSYSDSLIDEAVKNSREKGIYTTHSETTRPIHVPVFQRYPVNVPHPVPIAVPQYVRVHIPQPFPRYNHVQHRVEIPVYRIIPEIIEKLVPYTVEKPYPSKSTGERSPFDAEINFAIVLVQVEKPFPVQVVKKLEIPVPKPYPVHVIYYKHISEDDPPPQKTKSPLGVFGVKANQFSSLDYGGEISARVHHDYQFKGY
jgi:hypothetical protein